MLCLRVANYSTDELVWRSEDLPKQEPKGSSRMWCDPFWVQPKPYFWVKRRSCCLSKIIRFSNFLFFRKIVANQNDDDTHYTSLDLMKPKQMRKITFIMLYCWWVFRRSSDLWRRSDIRGWLSSNWSEIFIMSAHHLKVLN